MTKKLTAKKKKEDLNKLFAAYNRRLGMLYSSYIKKLASLDYGDDVLENDILFNFDNYPTLRKRLDDIFNDSVSIPLPALLDLEEAGREPFT